MGASNARGCGGKHLVAQHANDKNGVAGADFIAVRESGFFYASAVEEGAIATVHVDEAAAFFSLLDGEVEARHEFVVGEGVVGFAGAANAERPAGA